MLSASLKIRLGEGARDCLRIVDKSVKYKRSSVKYKASKDFIEVNVSAADPVALVSSLTSALKQLRIIASVDKTVSKLAAKESRRAKS